MTNLLEGLHRTLLLMRDEFGPSVSDTQLLNALTSTRVALIADANNIQAHSAQTSFVTAAMLMARSGHEVVLVAPDIPMVGPQPPLRPGTMIRELGKVGRDILPGVPFRMGQPSEEVDLAIVFGDTACLVPARHKLRLNADPWAAFILPIERSIRWSAQMWPFGALAAAGLAAGEAFKVAMLKLLHYAVSPSNTAERFAPTIEGHLRLALNKSPYCSDLGDIDCISGGAITNAILYCLARIPEVRAKGRIIEPDTADLSNLNRNALLLRSGCEFSKAVGLSKTLKYTGLHFVPMIERFEQATIDKIGPLAPTVVVGVDHIPTRWEVQKARPKFLAVGATSHWSAMASFHAEGLGCAHCLHNQDDPGEDLIPTTACVSFWAGLLAANYIVRHAAGASISPKEQQAYLTPFRPESLFISSVAVRRGCPTCQLNVAA